MSRLRYAGVTGTVGSGNMTNSATSHTFTAPLTYGNGVTVPTLVSGDSFLLSILDTSGNLSEVVQVTAYNSGTGVATIVRGQEGTSGVSHTSGDKVTMGAYATDFQPRNVDDPNDSGWASPLTYDVEFDTDTSSLPSGWSWVNQGSGTYAASFGAGVIAHPGSATDDVKMIVRNLPSESAWVATSKFGIAGVNSSGYTVGLILRNSSSGKLLILGLRHNPFGSTASSPTYSGFYFSSATAFDANVFTTVQTEDVYRYTRIQKVSGTSWSFFGSPDGVVWHTLATAVDVTAKFTPDQIGLGVYRTGAATPLWGGFHWFRVR